MAGLFKLFLWNKNCLCKRPFQNVAIFFCSVCLARPAPPPSSQYLFGQSYCKTVTAPLMWKKCPNCLHSHSFATTVWHTASRTVRLSPTQSCSVHFLCLCLVILSNYGASITLQFSCCLVPIKVLFDRCRIMPDRWVVEEKEYVPRAFLNSLAPWIPNYWP